MKLLITGAAGFIGSYLSRSLLGRGDIVVGVDNVNDYYDISLKYARLKQFQEHPNFLFEKVDISDTSGLSNIFSKHEFDVVVNLAAQAGVRYSLDNPSAYIQSNLVGFANILENCRKHSVKHLVFASSSSVYGANAKLPFSEHDGTNHPVSLYAATKKSNELMAHSYADLYGLPCTGIRFFTVYGPWGRPDMAMYKFTKKIAEGEPIDIYNHGEMIRDFTYIDDAINATLRLIDLDPSSNLRWDKYQPDPASSYAPYRIYNVGNNQPVKLIDFVNEIEKCLNKKAIKKMLPMQSGEVCATASDTKNLENAVGPLRRTSIQDGVKNFVEWYLEYTKLAHDPARTETLV